MTFSPETVQKLLRWLPFLQPVLKSLSTGFYELEHADDIAARNKLEDEWRAKEQGYVQQITVVQRERDTAVQQRDSLLTERNQLTVQIADRDTVIIGLHANVDKLARQNQELNDKITAKEAAIRASSDDDAFAALHGSTNQSPKDLP